MRRASSGTANTVSTAEDPVVVILLAATVPLFLRLFGQSEIRNRCESVRFNGSEIAIRKQTIAAQSWPVVRQCGWLGPVSTLNTKKRLCRHIHRQKKETITKFHFSEFSHVTSIPSIFAIQKTKTKHSPQPKLAGQDEHSGDTRGGRGPGGW